MSDEPFGPGYDWCDGACGRCALEPECPFAEPGGANPKWGPEFPPPPFSLLAERLRCAGLDYLVTLHTLIQELGVSDAETARRAWAAGARLASKVARLSTRLPSAVPQSPDCQANLMLVEELDRECVAALARLCSLGSPVAATFMTTRASLFALLEPLQRALPEDARRTLERLIACGRAPSPFAVVENAGRSCA